MSGQNIPFIQRLSSYLSLIRSYKAGVFGNPKEEILYHHELCKIINTYIQGDLENATILDFGCGQKATQAILFKVDGAKVFGIDIEVPTFKLSFSRLLLTKKLNGFERLLKSLGRHFLFDKRFFYQLAEIYKKCLPLKSFNRICIMDCEMVGFPDDLFDFIHSAWVFEHIKNVDATIAEVNRILKTTGIAYISVHLYPCLSGGHCLEWKNPDKHQPPRIPAWNHLRKNKFPVNTYLNILRLANYQKIFSRHMDVLSLKLTQEGESLLTPDIESELMEKGYTRDDLITNTATFLLKKKFKM